MTDILHRPIVVTLFANAAAASKREERIAPAELADRIRATTAPEKSALPWLKLATFGDKKTPLRPHPDGSGRMTGGSLRHDPNVLGITGTEADYDAEVMQFDEAAERLEKAGLAAILYTSPSHTEDAPRWRILAPLSQPMQPQHRAHMLGRLNGLFGGIFARESFTLSQSYFFGSVRRNPSHRVELVDGEPIDLHDELDESWIGPPGSGAGGTPSDAGPGEAREDAELVRRIVTGEGLHVEMTALAGRYLARGMTPAAARDVLRGLMLSYPDTARDERWRDRFASIPALIASAGQKYRGDTAEGRRAVARLIADMHRHRAPAAEIREAAIREAERHGLPPAVAHAIAEWLNRRERARTGGAHAA
jgi:hypothetical protein